MPELLDIQDWTGGERARVLVEAAEWGDRTMIAAVLQGAGYATVGCAGPEGTGHRCLLATGAGCTAALEADVVVHALRTTDPRNLEALRALRRERPDLPVVVEASAAVTRQRADDLAGCWVVEAPLTPERLLDAVERALAGVV
jgi:CheY-like chemotaxis protein